METQQNNGVEKRRRKVISRPVLVRSVKPGSGLSADYTRPAQTIPFWRAA